MLATRPGFAPAGRAHAHADERSAGHVAAASDTMRLVVVETFRKTWRHEIVSSHGFSVRLSGKSALTYKDSQGELHVDAEAMAGSGITMTVYSASIPDSPQRGRVQIMDNIDRAFRYAGWVLIPS
jgi:hypothetical protein